jgi:toxin FitB
MIILDSNVVSELMRPRPEPRVIAWLDRQPKTSVWTSAITIMEIRFGLEVMPRGKRQEVYAGGFDNLLRGIEYRIAFFDTEAAQRASVIMASRKMQGRPRELRDTMIAGIVLANHATLATRNVSHFDDLSDHLVDPWVA